MVAAYSLTALIINNGGNLVINCGRSLFYSSKVGEHSACGFLGIGNLKLKILCGDNARVAYLTAALAVENGFVKNDNCLFALACGDSMLAVCYNVKNFSFTLVFGVT